MSLAVVGILSMVTLGSYSIVTDGDYFTALVHREMEALLPVQQQQRPCPYHSPINEPLPLLSKMPSDVKEAVKIIAELRKQQGSRATFVQIGANDGVKNDLLFPVMKDNKTEWIGLLVEPQAVLFSSLQVLHADAGDWSFYNGVMDNGESCHTSGTVGFCETITPGKGGWRTQGQINQLVGEDPDGQARAFECDTKRMHMVIHSCVSSWYELIYKHAGPIFHQYSMARKELSANQPFFFNVDLVQIDTEGNDYHLVKMMDTQQELRPTCINWENRWIKPDERKQELEEHLHSRGYTTTSGPEDTLACLVQANTTAATL